MPDERSRLRAHLGLCSRPTGWCEPSLSPTPTLLVLNTCCIRENADNKLYGNLGHLKTWKGKREGRQIVVSGCLAQKDQELVAQKAAHVDVVMGTHNVHRAAELLEEAKSSDVPITEILAEAVIDDHAMFPSALPARRETSYNAWLTIQIGCDNNCAFCIVPAVRGPKFLDRMPTSSLKPSNWHLTVSPK